MGLGSSLNVDRQEEFVYENRKKFKQVFGNKYTYICDNNQNKYKCINNNK